MENTITGKEVKKDMEHLVILLHKEWERSGKTRAEVAISLSDTETVNQRLMEHILNRQQILDLDGLSFKQSMALSKENFVLLRLVKKIKKAENKVYAKGMDHTFSAELDNEEYKLFRKMIGTEEV